MARTKNNEGTLFPVSTDAHFQRVTGGRWTVVVPTDEVNAIAAAGGVSGVLLKSGDVTDAQITGDVHKSWTFKGDGFTALYTVPREAKPKNTSKGASKGASNGTAPGLDVDAIVAAAVAAALANAGLGQEQGQPELTPEPAPAPTTRRTIKSGTRVTNTRVASGKPRGSSRAMAMLDG